MHFLSICLHTTYVYASKDRHFGEKTLHTQIKTANIRNFIGKRSISFKFLQTAPIGQKEKCRGERSARPYGRLYSYQENKTASQSID